MGKIIDEIDVDIATVTRPIILIAWKLTKKEKKNILKFNGGWFIRGGISERRKMWGNLQCPKLTFLIKNVDMLSNDKKLLYIQNSTKNYWLCTSVK